MSLPIQIVDENDKPVTQATKQEAWERGLIHRVVYVMVQNKDGMLLLQHRAPAKDIFPNTWDPSVAGHVDAGEDYDAAAKREVAEELGFTDLNLVELGSYRTSKSWRGHQFNRFNRVYTAQSDKLPEQLEAGKIDGFRWFGLDEVKQLLRDSPEEVTYGLQEVIERYY